MEDTRKISMQTLPLELRHEILASVGDVASVVNAASTCRSLYDAFRTAQQHILKTAIIDTIGLDILTHAVLTYKCEQRCRKGPAGSRGWDRDDAARYTRQFLASAKQTDADSMEWTVQDAIGMQRLHFYVVEFTHKFIQACSDAPYGGGIRESLCTRPASRAERRRIMQAFYRFELYRRLFRTFGSISESESLQRSFLQLFSPWENAQLACVHDFLCRLASPAFNDVARHDVAWGRYRVCFDTDESSPYVQHVLAARGLAGIWDLAAAAAAGSYAERERLLCAGDAIPEIHCGFLYEALACMTEAPEEYADSIRLDLLVDQPPFSDDDDGGDDGPRSMWHQSLLHHNASEAGSGIATAAIYHVLDRSRRQWGYVMWDKARIDSLCLEDQFVWRASAALTDAQMPSQSEMVTSWRARKAIFDKGGRGRWSPDDDSQVVWTRLQK